MTAGDRDRTATAVIRGDGTAVVSGDGPDRVFRADDEERLFASVVEEIASRARSLGHAVPVDITDDGRTWGLLVSPEGEIEERASTPAPSGPPHAHAARPTDDAPVVPPRPPAPVAGAPASQASAAEAAEEPAVAPGPPSAQASSPASAAPPMPARPTPVPTAPEPSVQEPVSARTPSPAPSPASAPAQAPASAPAQAPAPPSAQPPLSARASAETPASAWAPVQAPVPARSSAPVVPPAPAPGVQPPQAGPVAARPAGASAAPAQADREPALPFGAAAPAPDRQSFLTQDEVREPATRGWQGLAWRLGIHVKPGAAERAERADVDVVSQHWPGPRTIATVNGKGGASKTPTTINLAAIFARYGGSGVVAWDNNQTRGTLGWRTEQGQHEATLHDLLPHVEHLLGSRAQAADLARFVHHQTRDRFDVLRSKPIVLAEEQRVSPADVDALHGVLAKYYRMILMDSGNDESDPMWLRMIDLSDQLVVATTTRDDHAEAGALLLEALAARDERSAHLARGAVVVVSQADPQAKASEVRTVADGYRSIAREVVTIPYDPAMVDGILRFDALRPATRRAWLRAGAAVARGL